MTATEILTKLVSFPVLGGESNLSIMTWIKEYIEVHDIEVVLVPNEENTKASLHCRIGPAVDGGVILSGHMDVVPVEGQDWHTDPFVLTDGGDGRLYGRGSCDMKGFLSCCLAALPEMVAADLNTPIYFAFSYDEEIGCLSAPDLIDHITAHYDESIKYAIIGEPSLMQPMIGQKGICVIETIVNGSAGHSSRIRQETSAIHEAVRLVAWLENKMNALVDAGRIDNRFDPPHSSLHVGMIHAGIAPNVIADHCEFKWDVRVIPQDVTEDIIAEFDAYCREREAEVRKTFPDFVIKSTQHHPPVPPLDTKESDDVVELVRSITPIQQTATVSYAAEAGQFSNGGYQSIICGPGSIAQAHRANEYIEIEQLHLGEQMLQNLVRRLSR